MISQVFYVNLDYRNDRKINMENTLPVLGAPVTRYPAIRPTHKEITEGKYQKYYARSIPRIKKYLDAEATLPRAFGIYGVYLSQRHIHSHWAANKGEGVYVIVEDDAAISVSTIMKIDRLFMERHVPDDWHMIRNIWNDEGKNHMDLSKFTSCHNESKYADKYSHGRYGGAHFSICNGARANEILEYLDRDFVYAIDSAYSTNQLNVYHTNLDVTIGDFGTDIPKIDLEPEPDPNGPVVHIL